MFGANQILDMGRWALFASQVQLQVTGENIANVETDGYARREVRLTEGPSINYSPGQLGTGVKAQEVFRHFDDMVERLYYDQSSISTRWGTLYEQLKGVEALFNESSGTGVSDTLSNYLNAWNDLSQHPDNYGARQTVVNSGTTLASTLRQVDESLTTMQQQIDFMIEEQVADANSIMDQIAELNKSINIYDQPGVNNTNSMYDERNRLLRDLSEIMDINVIDSGGGNMTVTTKAGQTLVDGVSSFDLEFNPPTKDPILSPQTTFEGEVFFEGQDNFEYTLEFLSNGGPVSGSVSNVNADAARFRVSLDGGNTWLADEDGVQKVFYAREYEDRVTVEGLDIWFGQENNPTGSPTGQFRAGDKYVINPQKGLYWVENTSSKVNITPQSGFNGEMNDERVTGGKLAALFNFRDQHVGKYLKKLDALTETMIWEVNRRHSQGAGLEKFKTLDGTYGVTDTAKALGSDSSGLVFNERLQSGTTMLYFYDRSTGNMVSNGALDFDTGTPGIQGFDPAQHSLEDVAQAYNNTFGTYVTASIVNNKLHVDMNEGYEMAFGADSAGLNAALGLNTFFQGSEATDIELNDKVTSDLDFLAHGHVNGAGEVNEGDNGTAKAIYGLREIGVQIFTPMEGTTNQSLLDYYNGLVGNVGADTKTAEFNRDYTETLAKDLNDRQQSVSGVNLDEEMSNLIKYQHSYTAAAKLITAADQMLQTVLSLTP